MDFLKQHTLAFYLSRWIRVVPIYWFTYLCTSLAEYSNFCVLFEGFGIGQVFGKTILEIQILIQKTILIIPSY